jgi:predicted permease
MELNVNVITPGYFETLGVPLVAGRDFSAVDRAGRARTVIVNEALAKRFFNGAAIGRHVTDSMDHKMEIVGVVRNGRFRTVAEEAPPTVFYPLAQDYSPGMSLIVRTDGPPERLVDTVRRAARTANPGVPVFRLVTLADHIREASTAERLSASLVSACGVLAVALAVVGLYGAVAYLVTRRTREIGVRMALGAEPRHVLMLVIGHGLLIALVGVAVGLIAALGFASLLRSMLFGVSATNVPTYIGVGCLLIAVAVLAAYIPARRAVRIDPARALSNP